MDWFVIDKSIDRAWTGITTRSQSGHGSNEKKGMTTHSSELSH